MRRAGTKLQAAELKEADLESKEIQRDLRYGQASRLAMVLKIMRMVRANQWPSNSLATRFLGEWLANAKPADVMVLAEHLKAVDGTSRDVDPKSRLVEFGRQIKQPGETVRDALRRAPKASLVRALESHGIREDWGTVLKSLNQLGVVRRSGRPKKPRNT